MVGLRMGEEGLVVGLRMGGGGGQGSGGGFWGGMEVGSG